MKRFAKGILIVGLLAAIAAASTGCSGMPRGASSFPDLTEADFSDGLFVKLPVRPQEEIEATGVTAEDILAGFNDMLEVYYLEQQRIKGQAIADDAGFSLKFKGIRPYNIPPRYENNPLFYTHKEETAISLVNRYQEDGEGYFKQGELLEISGDFYLAVLDFYITVNHKVRQATTLEIHVPSDTFRALMEVFDVEEFTFTQEDADKLIEEDDVGGFARGYLNGCAGMDVYSPTEITAEMITNANEAQLAALYAVFQDIKAINFDAVVPERLKD
ncbi:MAG: hypothetical protein J1E00_05390 [Oscillospiraceae bacterium]|nr:hypothetical protein [Oscillospiraceae bacterium]